MNSKMKMRLDSDTIWLEWFDDEGRPHRDGGPAYISTNGVEFYYQHGLYHRVGGPARIWENVREEYWENGKWIRSNSLEPTKPKLELVK